MFKKLGIQLYTVRETMRDAEGIRATFKALKEMGYDQAQTLKAIREAESYPGPSIIIAYCPCLEHGIKGGMSNSQIEQKRAVECGYWHMYRFDPRRKAEGLNPFVMDSKEPSPELMLDYLKSERRYASLLDASPERAQRPYEKEVKDAAERWENYKLRMDKE